MLMLLGMCNRTRVINGCWDLLLSFRLTASAVVGGSLQNDLHTLEQP